MSSKRKKPQRKQLEAAMARLRDERNRRAAARSFELAYRRLLPKNPLPPERKP
jgi:hypothetical protein